MDYESDLGKSEPQNIEYRIPNVEGWIRFAQSFFKLTKYIIRCWTFNVRCSFFR